MLRALLLGACTVLGAIAGCSAENAAERSLEVAAQGLYAGALSEDAELLIVGSLNHGASLWSTPENARLFNWAHQQGEYAELVAAAFSPDGSRAVTMDPRTLVLWDTGNGRALNYWATPGAVMDAALFSDNRTALLGLEDHSALVFDAQTGDYQRTLLHEGPVAAVAVAVDGTVALTGSDDQTAVLWRLNDGTAAQRYQHGSPVRVVALSSDNRYAFTAAQGDLVALWDNRSGQRVHVFQDGINHGVTAARFSDDGTRLAIGYANRKISLFAIPSGAALQRWDPGTRHPMRATGSAILELAFGPGALLAVTGDGRLLMLRSS